MDMPIMFPTDELLLAAIPLEGTRDVIQSIWLNADEEYEHAILANAHARRVARK